MVSVNTNTDIIVLVESTDNGRPAWWYVKCFNRISAEKLKGVCRLGRLDEIFFAEYGEVVRSGWGKTPPTDVVKDIEEKYNL